MLDWFRQRIQLPLHGWALALLIAAFLVPGLLGHDPWKTQDAIGMGVVHQMLSTGNWLTPQLADEAFLYDGPIYFWVAALFAKIFFFIPPHEAARFASTLFLLLSLWWVRLAARELYGKVEGDLSVLALLGCIGLMWHAHETTPETAMLAGLAGAYYGLAISSRKTLQGGIYFGIGAGVAFLAKGLTGLMQPLLAVLLVLPFCSEMRKREFGFAVGIGLIVLLPFVLIWPWLVAQHAPDYFENWWAWQLANISNRPHLHEFFYYLQTLAWAAWPAWPLTLWALWTYRRRMRDPAYAVPFVAGLVSLALLLFVDDPNEMDALALLVPLAIPAGAAALNLRRGAANALTWFAMTTFSLMAIFLWLMWFAALTGVPEKLAATPARLEPGFTFTLQPVQLIAALLLTLGWIVLLLRSERSTLRSLTHWAAGITLCWGLSATLWLDWIDYGRSYQPVARALKAHLPRHYTCIESRGLEISQRALFDYHANIVTKRFETYGNTQCPYLLVQSRSSASNPGKQWRRIWQGSRPRDKERYRLYRRISP